MKNIFYNLLKNLAINFTFILLIINIYGFKLRNEIPTIEQNGLKNDQAIIPIHKVMSYFNKETIILEDSEIKKINIEDNVCSNLIKDHEYINNPSSKSFNLENEAHQIDIRYERNVYYHVKETLKVLDFDVCNKVLKIKIPITNDLCEYETFNRYILKVEYLKIVKSVKMLQDMLKIGKFILIKIEDNFVLNTDIANFNKDEYFVFSGELKNNLISIDISDFIIKQVCPENISKKKNDNNPEKINPHEEILDIKKHVTFVFLTSHSLSGVIIFHEVATHANNIKPHINIRNIVKIKKSIKKEYIDLEMSSPCYNACDDKLSYQCKYNKCTEKDTTFCDKYFYISFNECLPMACEDMLKKNIPSNKDENNASPEKDVKYEEEEDIYGYEMTRRGKNKKLSLFMWIINNKSISLGILIFFIFAIIFGCLYCYFRSMVGFHNDEEYYISKYN
ncbi:conserved Plasmodium protein, unknown function [Plasmodium chabaudi chabaudi]|uniref:Uncharacterized protein n=1 Tax=Plasmodium chabaudi chabaudi TaxID=31271 RepID=A0A4V0KEA4_PLACU|nr:conserved Plasmodium protein, unknown function [Plasmodium chabaudi chabaudi]VTZ71035.1 conserved Plasmodium protein, unknown function [Plasmodium chabaudi chabaudi]|eukprot:XP_016654948.1 conserved Plasmodium protein, unknown function [Plasmodium chabaudi chabaudi]